MIRRSRLVSLVASALALPAPALADISEIFKDVEYYGYLKNETSFFTLGGQVTGQAKTTVDRTDNDKGEVLKFENSGRLFLNSDFGEESSWHLDLNVIYDTEGVNDNYRGYRIYSQHDWFREGYVDTAVGPLELRLGKQQVVWGTADGIKLLDIINPTDFREFAQNTFEDSRIPVWMGKAEMTLGDTGNAQFIVAQARENRIPGLSTKPDRRHPFILKGVDLITGRVNGFFNTAPRLAGVASAFSNLGVAGGSPIGLVPFVSTTVNDFATNSPLAAGFAPACGLFGVGDGSTTSAPCLKAITEAPLDIAGPGTAFGGNNQQVTNLIDSTTQAQWNIDSPKSIFEYMPAATFATFNTFGAGVRVKWDQKKPDADKVNLGFRWKDNIKETFNYSLNYFWSRDQNPSISVKWENNNGQTLKPLTIPAAAYAPLGIPVAPGTEARETVLLQGPSGEQYGVFNANPFDPASFGAPAAGAPTLVFEERYHRIHNLGGAFDYSFGVGLLDNPLVLRGEFLYQKDTRQPVIDRGELAIGNLTMGLLTEKQDQIKYVVGLDFLVWTNLTISGQFIQFINLDHVSKGSRVPGYRRYTGDLPSLALDTDLKQQNQHKEFYSLFLSKPFGPSQLGRVNNLLLYEEGGGWWNRFDVEYQFTDELVASTEWNYYWGDNNETAFGQFNNSSNFQVGLKYIFE